jgi:putative endonuclease
VEHGHANAPNRIACRRQAEKTARSGAGPDPAQALARKCFAHVPRTRIEQQLFYVYVLKSESDGSSYIGYSSNLRVRLWQHQNGRSRATSYRGPWKLIYYEAYLHQADTLGREKYLKSGGSRRFLKAQLRHYLADGFPRRTA